MLLSLYFPVTCNPSRAVTLPNIGVPRYIGVLYRVSYPYPSVLTTPAGVLSTHPSVLSTLFGVPPRIAYSTGLPCS